MNRIRSSFSDRRLAAVGSLLVLSLFVVAMIAVRVVHTGTLTHVAIAWNLVLASVPFVLALILYDRARARASRWTLGGLGALWLLFFPNAPYIVTDLKHLRLGGVPVWYDLLLLSAAAWAGLLIGFMSLYLVQAVARRLLGPLNGWIFVFGVLGLSSFGIYLGRFRRWNSWDVVVRPRPLFGEVARGLLDPADHPRPVAVTVLFTSFLFATYLVFYSFARMSAVVRD
jgi:uncharacterized membrane protein